MLKDDLCLLLNAVNSLIKKRGWARGEGGRAVGRRRLRLTAEEVAARRESRDGEQRSRSCATAASGGGGEKRRGRALAAADANRRWGWA